MALSIRNNSKLQTIFDQTKELKLEKNIWKNEKNFSGSIILIATPIIDNVLR